jgi:hypothetical protein
VSEYHSLNSTTLNCTQQAWAKCTAGAKYNLSAEQLSDVQALKVELLAFLETHPHLCNKIHSKIGPVYPSETTPPKDLPDDTDDSLVSIAAIIKDSLGLDVDGLNTGTAITGYSTKYDLGFLCTGGCEEDIEAYNKDGELYVEA